MAVDEGAVADLLSPVGSETEAGAPEDGIALCLSGGGYRAMLFHLGMLWRLNEVGYLPKLNRISSVSGGSITAGVLAAHWNELQFNSSGVSQEFRRIVEPVRKLGSKTIDISSVGIGLLLPGSSVSDRIVKELDGRLYSGKTLQDLPDLPRFVINATNLQSGALWRFSKPYMRDWRVGKVENPRVKLSVAVAASAAFPPFLSPVRLKLDPTTFTPGSGADLQREPFTSKVVLSDGGVYDNLGLETAWKRYKTILVSDGGGQMAPSEKPASDWAFHSKRVLDVIDNQVRSLRKRQTIDSFKTKLRHGTYWGIRTNIADYGLPDSLPCPQAKTILLADIETRLKGLHDDVQQQLINWGYAVCDAAMRRHVDGQLPAPVGFPYPGGV